MAEIRKTSSAKMNEREVRSQLDKMEGDMLQKIRHGNIYEEFVKSIRFKLTDFQDYFGNQWQKYKGQLIQDEEVKASYASFRSVNQNDIPTQNRAAILGKEGEQMLRQGMTDMMNQMASGGGKFKGAKVQKLKDDGAADDATSNPDPDEPMTIEELRSTAEGTLDDWENFMQDSWDQIMDAQMQADYTSRMAEIQKDVDRIIMLAKQGKIGPEFVLIALAKVNSTKNGVLISHLGRKAFHVNESINNVADDLNNMDPSDPGYFSELQMAQSQTRDKTFNLNLITQDMQKAMQDVAGCLEQVHGMISEINRVRREIISKVAARG